MERKDWEKWIGKNVPIHLKLKLLEIFLSLSMANSVALCNKFIISKMLFPSKEVSGVVSSNGFTKCKGVASYSTSSVERCAEGCTNSESSSS